LQIDGSNEQVMNLGNLTEKFTAFGYQVIEVFDGHNINQILDALNIPANGKPKMILCHTVKGKAFRLWKTRLAGMAKRPAKRKENRR
jgi:transketolase